MTDVSAGALAAGTGALPGMGKPPGAPVGRSDFETELNAFADSAATGLPGTQESAETAGGAFALALPATFSPSENGSGPGTGGGLPEQTASAGPVPAQNPGPASTPATGGAGSTPLPASAAGPQAGPVLPTGGNGEGAAENGSSGAPDTSLRSPGEPAQTLPQPVGLPDVPAKDSDALLAGPSVQPPVQPPQTALEPEIDLRTGAVAPQAAAVHTVPVAENTSPAPVPQADTLRMPDVVAPEAAVAASRPQFAGPAQGPAPDPAPVLENGPARSVAPTPAAQPAEQLLANGRRWQSELPSELRAPVPAFQKAAQAVPPSQASALAETTAAPAVASTVPTGGGAQTPAVPVQTPVQSAVLSETGAAQTQPVSSRRVDSPDPLPLVRSGTSGNVPGTGPLTQGTRPASQNGGADPLAAPAANDLSPDTEPDGFEPVSLKTEAAVKENKAPVQGPASETQTAGQGSQPGANTGPQGPQAAANAGDARSQAGPLAAAVLAGQLPLDDPEAVTKPVEFTTTGDFIATVRGGEAQGAVRTESLQTPNQAQSGQVATQVAAEIARNLKNGQTRFQMRFDPLELGRVDVNMRVGADGGVHAHLIVERPETLDMFLRDQRGLERALEAAGLKADSENLQFSLKQEGGRDFASGDGRDDGAAPVSEDTTGTENEDLDAESDAVIRLTLAESRGGLDVKI